MNLYELVHWGNPADGNGPDTIWFTRAESVEEAVLYTKGLLVPMFGEGAHFHSVRLIGRDLSAFKYPCPVRGPFLRYANNDGYESWAYKDGKWVEDCTAEDWQRVVRESSDQQDSAAELPVRRRSEVYIAGPRLRSITRDQSRSDSEKLEFVGPVHDQDIDIICNTLMRALVPDARMRRAYLVHVTYESVKELMTVVAVFGESISCEDIDPLRTVLDALFKRSQPPDVIVLDEAHDQLVREVTSPFFTQP